MNFILFEYTLFVLLISALASALSLSTYAVSKKKGMLFLSAAFLFYFLDVSWIFQSGFFYTSTSLSVRGYEIMISVMFVITGCGILTSIWLMVLEFFNTKTKRMIVTPALIFVAMSLASLFIGDESIRRFCFYVHRYIFAVMILIYIAYKYLSEQDESERKRMWYHSKFYVATWVIVILIVLEDIATFFLPEILNISAPFLKSERNFMENIYVLLCAFLTIRHSLRTLTLRFEMPDVYSSNKQSALLDEAMLAHYCTKHSLTEREREVLYYTILGMSTQEIATKLTLSNSTIKVHLHNVFKKTNTSGKQNLLQDFWQFE